MQLGDRTKHGGSSVDEPRPGASPGAIAAHYDLSDEFFRLVLGPDMVYSCALFEGRDDLATAQTRKLQYHITECRRAQCAARARCRLRLGRVADAPG